MSSINKLLIQGVRSFGPGDDHKAVITFGTPLTIITGQNGAGKTTVIECLKYITTGELPPNSRGGGFVHDPKLIGEREVKAVVKLKFKDIMNSMVTCHRMLASIQKPRKIEQKTLDSSMEKVTAAGEKIKITSRCGEIDKEMVAHLGVSKAILNTVVFCHQEDSTWPLSEGKNLKSKFDDIFASTRYTKALDNIRKLRQEQLHNCKLYESELGYLDKEKKTADKLQVTLKETEEKVASSKAEIQRIKSELEPTDARLQELNDMYEQVTQLERSIVRLETSKEEKVKSKQALEESITSPFMGTHSELQLMIDRHSSQLERSERCLKELNSKYEFICGEEKEARTQHNAQIQVHSKLMAEEERHQQQIQARDEHITAMAVTLGIAGYTDGPYSIRAVQTFVSMVTKHREGKEETAKAERQSYLGKEQELQEQLSELNTNLVQLNTSKEVKERNISEHKRKVAEIKRELANIRTGGEKLEEVEQQLKHADEELAEYRGGLDQEALDQAICSLSDQKKKNDDRVQTLQTELTKISQQASARGALEALRNQKRTLEEKYQNEMAGLEPDLLSLLGMLPGPDRNLVETLTKLERSKKAELQKGNEQGQRESTQLSRLEVQKEGIVKQLSDKKARAEQLQAEVAMVTGESNLPFEEAKIQLKKDIEKKLEDISTVRGSQSFFKKSLEKIHEKRVCPACSRGFNTQDEFERTIKVLSDRLNKSIPTLLPTMNKEVQELQEKQRKLIELRPKMDELTSLRSSIIPNLEKDLGEKAKTLNKLQTTSSKAKTEQIRLQNELETVRKVHPRALKTVEMQVELEELGQKISEKESRIGGGVTRSQVMVNRDLQEATRAADELNRKLDHKRQEITESQQALRELENTVHRLREEQLNLKAQQQKREQLVARKSELTTQVENLDREIKTLTHQLGPVEQQLSKLTNEKRALVREREDMESTHRKEIDSIKNKESTLQKMIAEITRYIERGTDRALAQCSKRLDELAELCNKKEDQKKEMEDQKQSVQEELHSAKNKKRDMEDNMRLMEYGEEISVKIEEIGRLKDELRRMGLEKYDEEYRRCQEISERLRKEKAHCEGQCEGREGQVRSLKQQLGGEMYRDIDKKHREKLIDLRTTEAAMGDLEKYHRAVDRAIMRFHTLKMEEINKILKDLWIKTYKGGDIDSIEIRSEDSSEGASAAQRRVYNYRVVMLKGQHALDMRGRCSAGQKMLASILIRLALAETFCLNCGLLALDEPTTNLDHDNMEGLAASLIDIIKDRSSSQKNLQLIIITHDEAFVELLGQAGFTDCYFRVSKEVGQCSLISRNYFGRASATHLPSD